MTASAETQHVDPAFDDMDWIARCRIFDLAHPWQPDMPVSPVHVPYSFTLSRRHGDMPRDDGVSTADELIVMSGHTGTHLDALGHASRDGRLIGGLSAAEVQAGGRGLTEMGVETIAPIVCRGVLLDVAAVHEVPTLPPAYEVTVADLEEASKRADLWPGKGDAVLIRTGWAKYWSDHRRFLGDEGLPGPGEPGVDWLADRGVEVTGSDTLVYEVVKPGHNRRPGHARLLVEAGIPIIENLNLESLSRDGPLKFIFMASPLTLVGATASPIRPVAICLPTTKQATAVTQPNV